MDFELNRKLGRPEPYETLGLHAPTEVQYLVSGPFAVAE